VRVAADLLRAFRVPEEVRVVALLPDEDQMRGGHELRDEFAAGSRARERRRRHAEPAGVVVIAVLPPELLLPEELHLLEQDPPYVSLGHPPRLAAGRGGSLSSPGKGILAADEANDAYKVAVRRRNLVLAFGLAAAIPFAATGVVLLMGASRLVLAAALATLYLSLFPIVAAASITLHRQAAESERLASYDTLTELPNRALFDQRLKAALEGDKPVDADGLLRRADAAMYAAKNHGGATFRIADPAANTSKGPGQAIGALRPVRRAAPARGGQRRLLPPGVRG
jgi:hypothetical protein